MKYRKSNLDDLIRHLISISKPVTKLYMTNAKLIYTDDSGAYPTYNKVLISNLRSLIEEFACLHINDEFDLVVMKNNEVYLLKT